MKSEAPKPSTRQDIVEKADLLFYQHGFENTSFADIADAVGISRGNFYYHFKTCLLYTSPSPRDKRQSRMPSSA